MMLEEMQDRQPNRSLAQRETIKALVGKVGSARVIAAMKKIEGHKKRLPKNDAVQANECPKVAARRNGVEWYIEKHPGCRRIDIATSLGLHHNTVAADILWLTARGRVHSVQVGMSRFCHPGKKPAQ